MYKKIKMYNTCIVFVSVVFSFFLVKPRRLIATLTSSLDTVMSRTFKIIAASSLVEMNGSFKMHVRIVWLLPTGARVFVQ